MIQDMWNRPPDTFETSVKEHLEGMAVHICSTCGRKFEGGTCVPCPHCGQSNCDNDG